jgi:hypothetical protein
MLGKPGARSQRHATNGTETEGCRGFDVTNGRAGLAQYVRITFGLRSDEAQISTGSTSSDHLARVFI